MRRPAHRGPSGMRTGARSACDEACDACPLCRVAAAIASVPRAPQAPRAAYVPHAPYEPRATRPHAPDTGPIRARRVPDMRPRAPARRPVLTVRPRARSAAAGCAGRRGPRCRTRGAGRWQAPPCRRTPVARSTVAHLRTDAMAAIDTVFPRRADGTAPDPCPEAPTARRVPGSRRAVCQKVALCDGESLVPPPSAVAQSPTGRSPYTGVYMSGTRFRTHVVAGDEHSGLLP